ncbi:MAG TPA: hypothetical protein VF928_12225 [Usitatibacteraceae bacterium]
MQIVTTGIVFQRDRAIASAREKNETRPLTRHLDHFWLEERASARVLLLGASKNLVVPAKAGTQSIQVFDSTKDWIPAFAGMRII